MDEHTPSYAEVRPLPSDATAPIAKAKTALDALAAKAGEPHFGWRESTVLGLFAGALGYGLAMGTLRWISFEKGAGWLEAAVPVACAALVGAATFWPRRRREPSDDARTRRAAEQALAAYGLAYLPAARTLASNSQIVWAHNWQPLDTED